MLDRMSSASRALLQLFKLKPADMPKREWQLIRRIRSEKLTYLSMRRLRCLSESCRMIERNDIPGMVVEAGCALGGSSILLARLKDPSRRMRVYDVFGMIPPPTDEDTDDVHARYALIKSGESRGIEGDKYYGYRGDLYSTVIENLTRFGVDCARDSVSLIKGLVEETMEIEQPVALAHVDVDWYSPVKTCLRCIVPHISPGGMMILDDYQDWGGCRKAVDEFLQAGSRPVSMDHSAGSLRITFLT
jgi:asparagine synthase (glutamine-hydrolysing)